MSSAHLYVPQSRPERLIAAGRVVLAASSLFAVWLDPSEPAKYAQVAYLLLAVYLLYAAVIALSLWRLEAPSRRGRLATHVVDLAFFSLFIYFTAGPGSPFSAFFVFSLVCATLRWGWRGTLWTAAASMAALVGVSIYFALVRDPDFELHISIIRGVYLAVMAMLLGYLGAHEERVRREMSLLAAWPQEAPAEMEELVRTLLAHAARIVGAPRLVLQWTEREEPWSHLVSWDGGALVWSREPPAAGEALVAPPLAGASFFCRDLRPAEPTVRFEPMALRRRPAAARAAVEPAAEAAEAMAGNGVPGAPDAPGEAPPPPPPGSGLERFRGAPLDRRLVERFRIRTVLSVPLAGEAVEGRLFFLDKRALTVDELVLAEVVTGAVGARLDHDLLSRELQQAAATEERIRLARDLHDGVLQSFTGVGLRLAAARRQLAGGPEAVREHLEELQRLITVEQRDLRFFISELEPSPKRPPGEVQSLPDRLAELAERMGREWDLGVELSLEAEVPEALGRQVYHLVREALVNAVRHGQASRVEVRLAAADGDVTLSVADDGRGFPFTGRRDGPTLARTEQGPKSLRQRVASLGGNLVVESAPGGARLEMVLPRGAGG